MTISIKSKVTVQQFYLETSDENERRAVEMLDRLMGEEEDVSVGAKTGRPAYSDPVK